VRFFTLKFECHSSYKLLLCNSENGDIACCNKTIHNGVFVYFSKNKNLFLLKKNKKRIKKTGGCFFLKTGFSQPRLLSFNPFL